MKISLLAGDEEIRSIPFICEGGTQIKTRMEWTTTEFARGTRVTLNEIDLEAVFMTIHGAVAPEVFRVVTMVSGAVGSGCF